MFTLAQAWNTHWATTYYALSLFFTMGYFYRLKYPDLIPSYLGQYNLVGLWLIMSFLPIKCEYCRVFHVNMSFSCYQSSSLLPPPLFLLSATHFLSPLQWRHNERDGVWNNQPGDCLLDRLFRRKPKKSPASMAFVWGIHRWPVNSPHKWPVTRKMFPFGDVFMLLCTPPPPPPPPPELH